MRLSASAGGVSGVTAARYLLWARWVAMASSAKVWVTCRIGGSMLLPVRDLRTDLLYNIPCLKSECGPLNVLFSGPRGVGTRLLHELGYEVHELPHFEVGHGLPV